MVVRDLAAAEAFYAGVLGLSVERRWQDEQGAPRAIWVGLSDGAFVAIERAGASEPLRSDHSPGFHCLALGIERAERETWRAKLEGAGCSVVRESPYSLYTRDPDGNLVALSHFPERS